MTIQLCLADAASGSSIDFIYASLGVANAFVIELRDTGKFGFVLPRSEIAPTCAETLAAVMAMAANAQEADVSTGKRSDPGRVEEETYHAG